MPKPKTKGVIRIRSSFSSTVTVADLDVTMDAEFDTPTGVTATNLYDDNSNSSAENSSYQMSFRQGSTQIGVLTLEWEARGDDPVSGLTVARTLEDQEFDPEPRATSVTPIADPDAYYSRNWAQPAFDSQEDVQVDQVTGLEMRVMAASGYSVVQTVTSTAPAELIISYAWKDSLGNDVITGSVKLQAASVAVSPYTLGSITIDDDDGQASALRAPGGADSGESTSAGGGRRRPRQGLRERLNALLAARRARRTRRR